MELFGNGITTLSIVLMWNSGNIINFIFIKFVDIA